MQSKVWISCDLGIGGDYEGLYAWLDEHRATECGSSDAYLTFTHTGDMMQCLHDELKQCVQLDKRSRIYVVRREEDGFRGSLLFGRRKAAPWRALVT